MKASNGLAITGLYGMGIVATVETEIPGLRRGHSVTWPKIVQNDYRRSRPFSSTGIKGLRLING